MRWVTLELNRRQAASEARPDPRKMEAETTASHRQVRELGIENEVLGKANTFFTPGHHNTSALNRRTRRRLPTHSIALMAKILGARAGYDVRKHRAARRGQRALARRRPDEAAAWEHEAPGDAYSDPRIRRALTRGGVDAGVRAVAASMRRHGQTGFNTRPRPDRPRWAAPSDPRGTLQPPLEPIHQAA